jgi:hypothetical protein
MFCIHEDSVDRELRPSTGRCPTAVRCGTVAALAALLTGCWSPPPPSGDGAFRFAVFGDGPYYPIENGRARRVFAALSARDEAFVIHVGDIMWQRCTDEAYRARRELMETIGHPVVYTPGDNEWSDCVDLARVDPLERLATLRRVFFADSTRSLGASALPLESQGAQSEFVEHARWFYGGVLFATVHVVGDANGGRPFAGREPRHAEEVERRTQAAVDWLRASFAAAVAGDAAAVVVAMHASLLHPPGDPDQIALEPIHDTLIELAKEFRKPVLLVHGDEHQYIVDRPFRDPVTGEPIPNLERLMTFGSPAIGWVDVVVDPTRADPFRFEPNVTPRWLWW